MTEYVYFPLLVGRAPNGMYYIGTQFGRESKELWETSEQAQEALDKDLWSLDQDDTSDE